MRFGKSAKEAREEPNRGGSGDWIRYLKEGDTTFRIIQEPDDWTYYWEHFSPAGFSFPCNNEETCPGCTSDNEKLSKVSRKIAFNVLQSVNGTDYVNVFKVGPTVGDKLENRFKRFGTVTDRDYTITRYKTSADRWDFEVEGGTPSPIEIEKYALRDVESMLAESWEDAWGDGDQARANRQAETPAPAARGRMTIAKTQSEEPPFEDKVYQEADLRKMIPEDLLAIISKELQVEPPEALVTTDDLVDWMLNMLS